MKKKKRAVLLLAAAFCAGAVLTPLAVGAGLGWWVARTTGGAVTFGRTAMLPVPGLDVRRLVASARPHVPLHLELDRVVLLRDPPGWHPGRRWHFALAGSGRTAGRRSHETTVSGRVSGSFSRGSYQVHELTVRIRDFGTATLSGTLEFAGGESVLQLDLADLSLAELSQTVERPELPVDGELRGRAELRLEREDDAWAARMVDFDVGFTELVFAGHALRPFSGRARGHYDFKEEQGAISEAVITAGPEGRAGRLDLAGTIGREGFDLTFEARNLFLEDIIEALPEELREKMGLELEDVSGRASYSSDSELFSSEASFRFHQAAGRGRLTGAAGGDGFLEAELALDGLDLLSLSRLYGEGAVVAGRADFDGALSFRRGGVEWLRARFATVPTRGERQYLNFRAVAALMALGADSPLRMLRDADYGYRRIAGEIHYHDDYLRVTGLARREPGRDYIVLGSLLGYQVNVSIDPRFNTVRLGDLKRRLDGIF